MAEKSWACCESQTHPTFDAFDGSGGDLSKATIIVREQGTPKIPVLASRIGCQPCQSSVVYRYHVCADATGLHVLGGGHRLAQPLRSVVAIIEQLGKQFLPGGVGGRVGTGMPGDFQTDQGVQFTNRLFTGRLEEAGIAISMDGRGRALDNVFVERLWWSVKYEHIYQHDHQTTKSLHQGLDTYLNFFNRKRPHQSLAYETPWDVYHGKVTVKGPMARP